MYNTISPEKMEIKYSSSEIGISDYLEKEMNRLIGIIKVGSNVKRSILFVPKKLPIPTIKLSTERLELKFPGIYREEAYYKPKNSKK